MTARTRLQQVWIIAQVQLRRVFFSRRSFWVYLLAIFPAVMFVGHGIDVKIRQARWTSRTVPAAVIESIREGDTDLDVLRRAGTPIQDHTYNQGRRRRDADARPSRRYMRYFDGRQIWDLNFEGGLLHSKRSRSLADFEEDRMVFAAVFQWFYLRLAIFFGCLGIFMNLFRAEMLDKTLHFWFLAPVRRDVLLAGKYLAGLITAVVIFTAGAVLSYAAMLWPQEPAELGAFWQSHGTEHLFWYAASATLGCVGYGSVFLAAGLLLRNPIIPAVVILLWESVNGILPPILQKLSVLYYVQSLAPVPAPIDASLPLLFRLLANPAEPPSVLGAVFGLLAVTALVLWVASRAVRRLEIHYAAD